LINGFGTGQLNAIVPVWATETAEHTSRGQFIAIEFTLNIFGVVVAYWLVSPLRPPLSHECCSLCYRNCSSSISSIRLYLSTNSHCSGLSFIDGGAAAIRWRFPIAFQIMPLLFLFGVVWFFPESPRWLVKVGREDEGRYVLGRLRGEEGADKEKAEAEFQDICNIASLEKSTSHSSSYFSMLTGRGSGKLHIGRRVQLVIWLQIMQEWVGIAGVTICT
jgi:hypothetical protein